jgi:hypothetical protein
MAEQITKYDGERFLIRVDFQFVGMIKDNYFIGVRDSRGQESPELGIGLFVSNAVLEPMGIAFTLEGGCVSESPYTVYIDAEGVKGNKVYWESMVEIRTADDLVYEDFHAWPESKRSKLKRSETRLIRFKGRK